MIHLGQDLKIEQNVQSIATNGVHKVTKWTNHGNALSHNCNHLSIK